MFLLDYETTKLHVVPPRLRHKQADFTSNDAQYGVYVRASTQMWAPLRWLKFFADMHEASSGEVSSHSRRAASVLVVHRWRKNWDHPSQVETAPLRIPETYVLYNYNVKIYIAGETTVGPASRSRS